MAKMPHLDHPLIKSSARPTAELMPPGNGQSGGQDVRQERGERQCCGWATCQSSGSILSDNRSICRTGWSHRHSKADSTARNYAYATRSLQTLIMIILSRHISITTMHTRKPPRILSVSHLSPLPLPSPPLFRYNLHDNYKITQQTGPHSAQATAVSPASSASQHFHSASLRHSGHPSPAWLWLYALACPRPAHRAGRSTSRPCRRRLCRLLCLRGQTFF